MNIESILWDFWNQSRITNKPNNTSDSKVEFENYLSENKQIIADVIEIAFLKKENEAMISERGWQGITDKELEWTRKNYSSFKFKPTLDMIRKSIEKENQK